MRVLGLRQFPKKENETLRMDGSRARVGAGPSMGDRGGCVRRAFLWSLGSVASYSAWRRQPLLLWSFPGP